MIKTLFFFTSFLLAVTFSFGQASSEVVVPTFGDKYSGFVKTLEAGQTDINYREFRESFIESEQFRIASKKTEEFGKLKTEMYALIEKKDYPAIIRTTKKMLSIDYTSMIAHKILRQTLKIIDDTVNAAKYKIIQFGLLNSIVKSGTGNSCAEGWPVIQIEEEYFILQMVGATLLKQGVDNTGGVCDKMEVKTAEGGNKTYYFEISKVFEGYKKLGIK